MRVHNPSYAIPLLAFVGASSAASCEANHFKKKLPQVFGLEVTDVTAAEVKGWTEYANSLPALPPLPVEPKPIDFCNVTVLYTHPGLNDTVMVTVWLPPKKSWNGRFLGQGGGGWAAGHEGALAPGVALNYAAANTDAGHSYMGHPADTLLGSKHWSLTSPGNVNLVLLQNFGYRTLDEMTWIAKDITKTYYDQAISYSYWHGCSTGGRQGLVLAQRYPSDYQGILSAAPAINWVTFLVTEYYSHVMMRELQYWPAPCEMNAITKAAIQACDELDGVKDGVVAAHGLCHFDPHSVVGQVYDCDGDERKITKEAAQIAAVAWSGPIKDGKLVWHGLAHDASLPGIDPLFGGLAQAVCDEANENCQSSPFGISADWIRQFVLKDPDYDLNNIDEELFHQILRTSRQQYHSLMDSADPDLTNFKNAGGKIIAWHGLADQLIPPNGTLDYYRRVSEVTPNPQDFFRYFEVPGIAHCFAGDGAFPATAIDSLVEWVEKGKAPEHLDGQSVPALSSNPEAAPYARPLCAWPQVAAYEGGDVSKASSFKCADDFGAAGKAHDEL